MRFINSDRVRDIHELVLQAKSLGQMLAKRPHPVSFGGMVPRRKIMDPKFPRQMHRGFRNLTTDEGLQAGSGGLRNLALGRARAPTDAPDLIEPPGNVQRLAPKGCGNPLGQGNG